MKDKSENTSMVSLVVPVYNCDKYLKRCIESLIRQEYENIEILLVDDGSTDNSNNIIQYYQKKDKRIKAIHQTNKGVSVARNVGIKNANGNFISFIDSDDYVEPDYVSYLYSLINNEDVQISTTQCIYKFNDINEKMYSNTFVEDVKILSGVETAEATLYYKIDVYPFNKLFNINFLKHNNLKFNEKLSYGEDFEFIIKCFQKANKIAIGNKIIYNYYEGNPNSAMSKYTKKMIEDCIKSQDNIRESLLKVNDKLFKACKYSNWHTCCDCLNTMVGCNQHINDKKIYKMLKDICRKDSIVCITAPINFKNKIKGVLYFISPYLTAKMVKKIGKRKFK